jgi:hypothetical protein
MYFLCSMYFLCCSMYFLCCSIYCLLRDVPCIVCVYMCTEQLPPGGYPIAVKFIISYIKRWAKRQIAYRRIRWALSTLATKTWIANWKSVPIWLVFTGAKWPSSLNCHFTSGKEKSWLRKQETWFSFRLLRHVLYDSKAPTKLAPSSFLYISGPEILYVCKSINFS